MRCIIQAVKSFPLSPESSLRQSSHVPETELSPETPIMKLKTMLTALLVLALSVQAFGQQPAGQTSGRADADEVVRITTNVVQLDFVVTDKRGNQVTDLKDDDIEVFEDGQPQQITNFSYVSAQPPSTTPAASEVVRADKTSLPRAATARRENVRRTFAIVVDDLGMSFETIVPARAELRKFVEQQVQPGDLVAIVRTGGGGGTLQQFTTDKRQLFSAIDRLRWNSCSRRGISNTTPLTQEGLTRGNLMEGTRGGNTVPQLDLPYCSGDSIDQTLQSLSAIIGGMRELPGRKSLVIFTDSIPLQKPKPDSGMNPPTIGNSILPNVSYVDPLRKLAELAIRSSVVIYAIDTRGLTALNVSAADDTAGVSSSDISTLTNARVDEMFEGREGTESLAHQTGGFVVKNTNDISLGLGRIMKDLGGYYLVGYRPTSETFNRQYHRISARLRNHPELVVRSRTGFYGVREEESRPKTPAAADRFALALTSPFSASDLDVQFTPIFTNDAATGSFLRTLLHIDGQGLTYKPDADGWQIADIVLRGVLFGDNGNIIDEHHGSYTVRLRGATLKRAQSKGLDYVFNMPVKKPGAYQFRIAVLDVTSGHIGSAGQLVEIPDLKNRVALSSLVVRGITPTAKSANSSPGQLPAATTVGLSEPQDSEATPALRRFRQQMLLDYNYVIFNASIDKATGRPQLRGRTRLFRDGQQVFDNEMPVEISQQLDRMRGVVRGQLTLGNDLPFGDYVLQITVTDSLAPKDRQTTMQWIDFTIVK